MDGEKNNDIVKGNAAARHSCSRGAREWIGAMRSAKMRSHMDFDLLLADNEKQDASEMEAALIQAALDHGKQEAEEELLQKRLRAARDIENHRFQLSHKVQYRDAHLADAEPFTENSTKPRVDAWQRKRAEPTGEDREYSARERALWQPISEGTVLPHQQHSHALLYRQIGQINQAWAPSSSSQAPSNVSMSDSQAFGAENDILKMWGTMSKVSTAASRNRPRSGLRQLVRCRDASNTAQSRKKPQRPGSAPGSGRRRAVRSSANT
eukprot:gnl/MRDRNA2_/MRDRNA2_94001_c0_seq1.p1 gnl/MRDRNA2_/MRDRNA2_94001_c0~~gnl/MRDRNA2_/MRDRNA2_94001_c0_seq1.p1  ORF type:complete len:266 (+),score=55.47 gnl/MRDRNA2_/MRDRNA2_94001_c0_seq1:196-993(+)